MNSESRHKRRRKECSCYSWLKKAAQKAQRTGWPHSTSSPTMQMLSIFNLIFRRVPVSIPTPYSPPSPSPNHLQESEMALRLGVPRRYLEVVLLRGCVPYAILFGHIRQGGVLRRDAIHELRKRIPDAAVDWLKHIEKQGRWADLTYCYVPTEHEDETDLKLLESTLLWLGQSEGKGEVTTSTNEPVGPK